MYLWKYILPRSINVCYVSFQTTFYAQNSLNLCAFNKIELVLNVLLCDSWENVPPVNNVSQIHLAPGPPQIHVSVLRKTTRSPLMAPVLWPTLLDCSSCFSPRPWAPPLHAHAYLPIWTRTCFWFPFSFWWTFSVPSLPPSPKGKQAS